MVIYESETISRDKLQEMRKRNVCKECGGPLNVFMDFKTGRAFLACNDWKRTGHEGIEREANRYEQEGLCALNIPTRRKIMEQEYGTEKTRALAKYEGVVSLTTEDARKVITTLWPKAEQASPEEVFKAITICTQYGLNPLMRHLDLVPHWNSDKKKYDYVCILEIKANRLIASRKHRWTFLDDTPRISTEEEEVKHYRKLDPDKFRAIAKIRDIETGSEVTAWGEWPLWKKDKNGNIVANEPKGVEKGNSMENMACIHAERKGLDMLYPADMPSNDIPVTDGDYIDSTAKEIAEEEPEPEQPEPEPEPEPEKEREPEKPKQSKKSETEQSQEPTPNTVEQLKLVMAECNYGAMEVGAYCNQPPRSWGISDYKDLKPEQIKELIEHIKANPK